MALRNVRGELIYLGRAQAAVFRATMGERHEGDAVKPANRWISARASRSRKAAWKGFVRSVRCPRCRVPNLRNLTRTADCLSDEHLVEWREETEEVRA
jgi:hypothetical protein